MKHNLDSEISNAERKHSEETLQLRRRVLDNENMIKDLENNSVNNLKQHQMLVEQLSEKHEAAMKQITAKFGAVLNDLTDIKTKLIKVTDALNDMTTERDALLGLLADAKQSIGQLDNDNASAKKTIIELTEQLNQSMADRADVVSKTKGVLENLEISRKAEFMKNETEPNEEIIEIEEDYEIDEEDEDNSVEAADD